MSKTIWAKAKAELERRGWHQGDFYDHGKPKASAPVCLAGAICAAVTGNPESELHPAADRAFDVLIGRFDGTIAQWNDRPERRVEDVYALLDELDAAARETL